MSEDEVEVTLENLQMIARKLLDAAKDALRYYDISNQRTVCIKDGDPVNFASEQEIPEEFRGREDWREAYTNHLIETKGGFAVYATEIDEVLHVSTGEKEKAIMITLSLSNIDYLYLQYFDMKDNNITFGEYIENTSHPEPKYPNLLDLDYIMSLD